MNCTSNVRWNKTESHLSIDVSLDKASKIKGDLSNMLGKNIMKVFDKPFKRGNHRILKKVKNIAKGSYIMKIMTEESSNVIRFIVD